MATRKPRLAYLLYADNRCYTKAVLRSPVGVRADRQANTWRDEKRTFPINHGDPQVRYNGRQVIGVYEMTSEGLTRMLRDSKEATNYHDSLDD